MRIKIEKPNNHSVNKEELILKINSFPLIATTSSDVWYCSA
ncbi:hypothetical protein [Legionella steigerwaltii]|nr:hypothetical protein [Legionella steigerwaltii]